MIPRENPFPHEIHALTDLSEEFKQAIRTSLPEDETILSILMLPPQPFMKRGGIPRQVLLSTTHGILHVQDGKPPLAIYLPAESLLYVYYKLILLYGSLESASVIVLEVVLSPRSQLIGQTLRESHIREKYDMTALAVWNGERVFRTGLSDLRLSFGDSLLLQGPREKLPLLQLDNDMIVLSKEESPQRQDLTKKSWLTLGIFGLTIFAAALGRFSVSEVMLTGAIVMVMANIVTLEQAYRAIEWRIVFLVAGMLPLGLAMTQTGATSLFANALTSALHPFGPLALLLGLLTLTVLLSQAMKGAAVSAVIAPIAIEAARQFNVDPRAMAMGVALATSLAFVTPLGHPVNILMMGPGGYRFKDFFKVGLPLTIISFIVILIILPIAWPLIP